MHGRISPRRACNPCGYTMKISSRYHRLLIYDVKRTTKIDGMGPFKLLRYYCCDSQQEPDSHIVRYRQFIQKTQQICLIIY